MTKVVVTANAAINSDATFRAWGVAFSGALASAGLVQTADSGQINWATVTKPTGAVGFAGYEIWRFNDSLQGTAPIYIKFGYRAANNTSGNNSVLTVQVGTGTDGAGELTGAVSTNAYFGNYSSTTASTNTAQTIRACHTEGYAMVIADSQLTGTSVAQSPCVLVISRTLDATGTPTGEGAYVWGMISDSTGSGVLKAFAVNFNTATVHPLGSPAAAPPGDLANYDVGNTTYVLPHYACIPHPVLVAGVVSTRYPNLGGWSEGFQFNCAVAGPTSRNYLVLGRESASTNARFSGNNLFGTTSSGLLTYEGLWESAGVVWE